MNRSRRRTNVIEERPHAVGAPGLRPAGRHRAGGLCHGRWAGVARVGPQPLPPGDVYRQRLTPCRARGGPGQPAHRGLRAAVRAAVQAARHRHPLRAPRVWRAVSGGASPIARPSRELLVFPGRGKKKKKKKKNQVICTTFHDGAISDIMKNMRS